MVLMALTTLYGRHFVLLVVFYFLTFHPYLILIPYTINTLRSSSSCTPSAAEGKLHKFHPLTAALKITVGFLCYPEHEPLHPKGLLGLVISARLCQHATEGSWSRDNNYTIAVAPYQVRSKHVCLTGVFSVLAYKQHPASAVILFLRQGSWHREC